MINFNIYYAATDSTNNTILSMAKSQTIFELKASIVSAVDCEYEDVSIYLSNYGLLDNEDSLELPLEILGLEENEFYSLFVVGYNNKNNINQNIWRVFCSEKIFGKVPITQPGFITSENKNSLVCYACKSICRNNVLVSENILENNFYCLCGEKCLFNQCNINDTPTIFKNINSMLLFHADELYKREKNRINKIKSEVMNRSFDFEKSINFGLQRVLMYSDPLVKEKVLKIIPLNDIKEEAMLNSKKSSTDFRDEQVKSLLSWFRRYYSWCDKAKCSKCQLESDSYICTEKPNADEVQWLASRTEVYKCSKCNTLNRFARYNNPAKLCDTKTGRCGEWANLFGCILACLNYDVRFVDNFEDHVWNEYYSVSYGRWIHVDSCETAWDTPLVYEQGWGRNMTFVLAHSVTGIYDVTRRYVKDWDLIADRRRQSEIDRLNKLIEVRNNSLRENIPADQIELLYERDMIEQMELLKVKSIGEAEIIGRQSGDEQWRKDRGEIK